jgi:ornithine decarboxylase
MRTGFNGFTAGETVIVADEPMETAYGVTEESPNRVIRFQQKS